MAVQDPAAAPAGADTPAPTQTSAYSDASSDAVLAERMAALEAPDGVEVDESVPVPDAGIVPASLTAEPDAAPELATPAATPTVDPRDAKIASLESGLSDLTSMFKEFMGRTAEPANAPPPTAQPEPEVRPWEQSSAARFQAAARADLGDVDQDVLKEYAGHAAKIAEWSPYAEHAEHGVKAKAAIARSQRSMRTLLRMATAEQENRANRTRLDRLENQPQLARERETIRGAITAEGLAQAYPAVARAVTAGHTDVDRILGGLDLDAILSDPTTRAALVTDEGPIDQRLRLLEANLRGAQSSAAAPAAVTPATPAKVAPPGVAITNPGAIVIPDQGGAAAANTDEWLTQEENDALLQRRYQTLHAAN